MSQDAAGFIATRLRLQPVPGLAGTCLYTAHSGSRLSQLPCFNGSDPPPPYWAYQWAGGLALAHHIRRHPDAVRGRQVLDLGAGSGLVGIVAAQAGARVSAAEIDANARVAIGLNAAANGVSIALIEQPLEGPVPNDIELIAAGDVFYNQAVARRMLPFLERCQAAGIEVLVGDPDRRDLPLERLERVARYSVGDVGDARHSAERVGSVYRLRAAQSLLGA